MTKKDYELIADVIDQLPLGDEGTRVVVAKEFAWALERAHPSFDRARFLRACGL